MTTEEPVASARDLIAAYGDKVVLDGVNLDIQPQEILTIIGGSGSGKTTLLKHFIGLEQPRSGRIEIFGQDWWEMGETEREDARRRIGVLLPRCRSGARGQ